MTVWRTLLLATLALAAIGAGIAGLQPQERVVLLLDAPRDASSLLRFGGTHTVAQTVHAPFRGLARLDLPLLLPGRERAYPLFVHLRASPDDRTDLRTIVIGPRHVDPKPKEDALELRFGPKLTQRHGGELTIVLEASP